MDPRATPTLLATLALALVAGAGSVHLEVFAHPGCPLGRRFITRVLNQTITAPGIGEILTVEYSAIGRSYYPTTTCGDDRGCFLEHCGNGKSKEQRPMECFMRDMVCEGDQKECSVIRSLSCAKSLADTGLQLMQINNCVADLYHLYDDGGVSDCSNYFKLGSKTHPSETSSSDTERLVNCFNSEDGDEAILSEMAVVPPHVDSPLVRVDGKKLEDAAMRAVDHKYLLKAVCKAFAAGHQEDEVPPEACQQGFALASQQSEILQSNEEASATSGPHVVSKRAEGVAPLLRGKQGASLLAVETTTLVLR